VLIFPTDQTTAQMEATPETKPLGQSGEWHSRIDRVYETASSAGAANWRGVRQV